MLEAAFRKNDMWRQFTAFLRYDEKVSQKTFRIIFCVRNVWTPFRVTSKNILLNHVRKFVYEFKFEI